MSLRYELFRLSAIRIQPKYKCFSNILEHKIFHHITRDLDNAAPILADKSTFYSQIGVAKIQTIRKWQQLQKPKRNGSRYKWLILVDKD